jgi:hypothetical protein
MGFDRK